MVKWCNWDFLWSAQIPGFWNPMVKWCNWDFLWSKIGIVSDQKSSSAGSIPVSPNRNGSTREQSSHLSHPELVSWCAWPGEKSIDRWTQKPSPCGARFLIRENPNCTILPLDSRNQESAQIPGFWNFSLISEIESVSLCESRTWMIEDGSIDMTETYVT